jgi:hypothetical protein
LELLLRIGYTPDYIHEKVEGGFEFELVLIDFRDVMGPGGSRAPLPRPATWNGVLTIVAAAFPSVGKRCLQHAGALATSSFSQLEREFGASLFEVRASGPQHPKYMALERLEAIEAPCAGDVRAFLYLQAGCRDLFAGDGRTRCHNGLDAGLREYMCLNLRRDALPNSVRVVQLPSPGEDISDLGFTDEEAVENPAEEELEANFPDATSSKDAKTEVEHINAGAGKNASNIAFSLGLAVAGGIVGFALARLMDVWGLREQSPTTSEDHVVASSPAQRFPASALQKRLVRDVFVQVKGCSASGPPACSRSMS